MCIRKCGLENQLKTVHPDIEHGNFVRMPPWHKNSTKLNYTKLPASKNQCTPYQLNRATHTAIQSVEDRNTFAYCTDGSILQEEHLSGAAVYSSSFTTSWRFSNNCSTLQTELVAINKHYSTQHKTRGKA